MACLNLKMVGVAVLSNFASLRQGLLCSLERCGVGLGRARFTAAKFKTWRQSEIRWLVEKRDFHAKNSKRFPRNSFGYEKAMFPKL